MVATMSIATFLKGRMEKQLEIEIQKNSGRKVLQIDKLLLKDTDVSL